MHELRFSFSILKKKLKQNKLFFLNKSLSFILCTIGTLCMSRLFFYFYISKNSQHRENITFAKDQLQRFFFVNNGESLEFLLNVLSWGSFILLITLIVFTFFSFFIRVRRDLLLNSEEILIKTLLGIKPQIISFEFYIDYLVSTVISVILGTILVEFIYSFLYSKVSIWIKNSLITPYNFLVTYDIYYLLFIIILLVVGFFFVNHYIKKNFYKIV